MGRKIEQTVFQRGNADDQQANEKLLNITNHQKIDANANQNHRQHLIPIRMAILKKVTSNKCGKDMEKREPLYTVGKNVNWWNFHHGKQYGGFFTNSKQNCI